MASSSSKAMVISSLVLRLLALFLLGASIAVLVTDRVTIDGSTTTFKDVIAYRYVFATGAVGFVYTLFQIPFAIYRAFTGKRMIRNECIPEFDFYADEIIALYLATGVGAGFATTFELKKLFHDFLNILAPLNVQGIDESKSKADHFFDRANIAIGLLFLGFLCTAIVSILSSINRTTSSSKGFFG